ncbi:phosphatase PAP2 family protein [Nocardiopsis composta]
MEGLGALPGGLRRRHRAERALRPRRRGGGWPAALLVGWSRVHLGDHTPGQVAVGGLIGAAAMAVFAALG